MAITCRVSRVEEMFRLVTVILMAFAMEPEKTNGYTNKTTEKAREIAENAIEITGNLVEGAEKVKVREEQEKPTRPNKKLQADDLGIEINGFSFCGASAIGDYWALTAAHCILLNKKNTLLWSKVLKVDSHYSAALRHAPLHATARFILYMYAKCHHTLACMARLRTKRRQGFNMKGEKLALRAGSISKGSNGTLHRGLETYPHPRFDMSFRVKDDDIGLIQVKDSFSTNKYVSYIGLPFQWEPVRDGTRATVIGWGLTQQNLLGRGSPVLKKVEVDVLTPKECEYNLHLTGVLALTDNMFCAQQEGKSSYKTHSTLDRDSNLNLPVIGSLVYCKSSYLDHVATRQVHSTHPSPQCPSVVAQRGRLVTQPPPPPAITTHLPLTYIRLQSSLAFGRHTENMTREGRRGLKKSGNPWGESVSLETVVGRRFCVLEVQLIVVRFVPGRFCGLERLMIVEFCSREILCPWQIDGRVLFEGDSVSLGDSLWSCVLFQGDSGGPLFVQEENQVKQIGLVSWVTPPITRLYGLELRVISGIIPNPTIYLTTDSSPQAILTDPDHRSCGRVGKGQPYFVFVVDKHRDCANNKVFKADEDELRVVIDFSSFDLSS
uniref:Peptidase S1 domain-containing protein n=1 Tax=Timema cristinae TaxID=61476 RepID=A0A7R9GXB5_TIMCR|nr:unnamed protein product [Timema cristinae]